MNTKNFGERRRRSAANTARESDACRYIDDEPVELMRDDRDEDRRSRSRKVIKELRAELPREERRESLTFIVPRSLLPDISRLRPLGAPEAQRKKPEPVKIASRHRYKLIVDFSKIKGANRRTPLGKLPYRRREASIDPDVAAAEEFDYSEIDERDEIGDTRTFSLESDYADDPDIDDDYEDEPQVQDEEDGLSLAVVSGFGFASQTPERQPESIPPRRKKKPRFHLGARRISPAVARNLRPYTLPPTTTSEPPVKRETKQTPASRRRSRYDY